MMPSRAGSGRPGVGSGQTPEYIAAAIAEFLELHPGCTVLEDGKILFDFRSATHTLSTERGVCTLQIWDEQGNIVRRVTAVERRSAGGETILRLVTLRFGQSRPGCLELSAQGERRTPGTRQANRTRYLRTLERAIARRWGDWKLDRLRTALDLERSFGPAYARGSLVKGQQAWAIIGVNGQESQTTVDGILTVGVLWLAYCREHAGGKRLFKGLRMIVPKGMATLTASRLAWMSPEAGAWELWELDEKSEDLEERDAADHGNLTTRLVRLPDEAAVRERFAQSISTALSLVPEHSRHVVEVRVRSNAEVAFLLHGLEFGRVRAGYAGLGFNRVQEITFGAGANETVLTGQNEPELRDMVARLFTRRAVQKPGPETGAAPPKPGRGDFSDPLYRMQPERWLESVLRRDVSLIDPSLDPDRVYTQVPAFAASDRGMLDLLGVDRDGRLAVIELKADDDLHLALQGLDYWVRVRWHHMQTTDTANRTSFGLGEFQRHGYFSGVRLSQASPKLYLVAPGLRIHPATELLLRHLSPEVEWELVALDERWREKIRVIWRKRSKRSF